MYIKLFLFYLKTQMYIVLMRYNSHATQFTNLKQTIAVCSVCLEINQQDETITII